MALRDFWKRHRRLVAYCAIGFVVLVPTGMAPRIRKGAMTVEELHRRYFSGQ